MHLFTGGTSLSPRDVRPEAVVPLIDRKINGIMETASRYGQKRMPYAMLLSNVSGFIGSTLVLTLPSSKNGVEESMDAHFPQILHPFNVK